MPHRRALVLLAENPGAFLNLGAQLPENVRIVLFTLGIATALIGLGAYVLRRRLPPLAFLAFGLVLAGGLLAVGWSTSRSSDCSSRGGRLQTGIFNAADLYIVAGAVIMAWMSMSRRRADPIET